jgi:hypothetical protein
MSLPVPTVEPIDGPEIDRLITALLNISGLFHQIIEATPEFAADDADGMVIIGQAAERAGRLLAGAEQFYSEADLAQITNFLAIATVVLAHGMGVSDLFRPPGWLN